MSAASQNVHSATGMRQLGTAFAAILAAAALITLLALGQQSATKPGTAPAAGSAPVIHDHGWSTAPSSEVRLAPVPGEFRLGPGNNEPAGITVPLATGLSAAPVPGEFRLGPGNNEPAGITVPLD